MKTFLTLLAFSFCAQSSQSQNVDWAITGGGLMNDRIVSFVTDHSSATYMLIQDDTGIVLDSRIEKHDAYGTFIWSIPIAAGIRVYKLLLTSQNDLCLFANTNDTILFSGTNLFPGMFCARIDLNGNCTSVRNANLYKPYSSFNDNFDYNDFSIDSTGRVYATGTWNAFMNQQDEFQHLKGWHTGYFEMVDSSLSTLTYSTENVNKTYGFQSDALRNGGAVYSMTQNISGHGKFKLFRTDENFNILWTAQPSSGTDCGLADVVMDQDDQVYIAGSFADTISLNGFTLADTSSYSNLFVARLDGSGNVAWGIEISTPFIWGGTFHLSRILNDHIYLSCICANSIKVSGNTLAIPDTNFVLLCLDLNGNVVWNYYLNYTYFNFTGYEVSIDDDENIYLHGVFENNFFYNNAPSNGRYDWYIMRLPNTNVGVSEVTTRQDGISIAPNPSSGSATLYISESVPKMSVVSAYDILGNKIFSYKTNSLRTELDFGNCEAGLYFVSVTGDHFFKTIKFNKIK